MEQINSCEGLCGYYDGDEFPGEPVVSSGTGAIYTAFLRCRRDACRAIELAAEEDALEDAAWLVLKQRLNQLAGTAGYFGEVELGLLARDLEHGLDFLSPRGRTRRLRIAKAEFQNLAAP